MLLLLIYYSKYMLSIVTEHLPSTHTKKSSFPTLRHLISHDARHTPLKCSHMHVQTEFPHSSLNRLAQPLFLLNPIHSDSNPSRLFCHHQVLLSLPHKSLGPPILSSPCAPPSALCNMQCTNCYSSCSLFPSSFILCLSIKRILSSRQLSCSKNLQKFLTFQSDTLGLRTSGSSLIFHNRFPLINESLLGHGYLFSVPSAPLILKAQESIMLKAMETGNRSNFV